MNNKFIKISLIICTSLILLLVFFSMTSVNEDYFEQLNDSIEITYKDCVETKDSYNVSILIRNKSKNIASMSDMELSFSYDGDSDDMGDFYIRGYEKDILGEDTEMGIDPGKEKEFVFKISKGIKIDENYYDINRMQISYHADLFKFRVSENSLFLGVDQVGGVEFIGESYH